MREESAAESVECTFLSFAASADTQTHISLAHTSEAHWFIQISSAIQWEEEDMHVFDFLTTGTIFLKRCVRNINLRKRKLT